MLLVYFSILVISSLIALALGWMGYKNYSWKAGLFLFLILSTIVTAWINWKIKNGPYP
jgi:hypothetical protein